MASSYASSRSREVEHRSASACKFEQSKIVIQNEDNWRIQNEIEADDCASLLSAPDAFADGGASAKKFAKCISLVDGTSIRVAPMERTRGGWDDEHFHENLKLPEGSNAGRGVVVMLEAIGRECVAIALSPYHSFELGKTYVVHFGANGNLSTVIRRRLNLDEAVDASFPSRVCSEDHWVPYWIVLQNGKLSAGVGRIPGKRCIGTLDDSMYNMLRSGIDAVRYVGIGNSALSRNARDVRVRNVWMMSIPDHFGFAGIPIEEIQINDSRGFVNILEEYGNHGIERGDTASADRGGVAPTDAELLAEYERECAKARARAAKFGIEYKEPTPDAYLRWSEARRLRANPERGFITGIDTFSNEEKAKANARKERFARDERKRKGQEIIMDRSDFEDMQYGEDGEEEAEIMEDNEGANDIAEWENTKKKPLPVEQAWDNWEQVQQFRVDPPANLSSNNDFAQAVNNFSESLLSNAGDGAKKIVFSTNVALVPNKVHIFGIDWAPFKQIRTDDLMHYFKDYGPSYVEWLGELSCNVLFEDKHSAARAFHALSQELPTPPPDSIQHAVSDFNNHPNDHDMIDTAKGNENDGTTDANASRPLEDPAVKQKSLSLPDYGMVGWRFCRWTVRKVNNDRYGRRGTRARVLMRLATSADVLDDRPTEWPRPPPGFSTKRVLMPTNNHIKRRQRDRRDTKRRKRGGREGRSEREKNEKYTEDMGGEHPMLSKGLRSGRAGFSIEEMEAERNAKRTTGETLQ